MRLELHFLAGVLGADTTEPYVTNTTFYDAAIKMDAILGCPWLSSRKLGIFRTLMRLLVFTRNGAL